MTFKEKVLEIVENKSISTMEEFLKLNPFNRVIDVCKEEEKYNDLVELVSKIPSKGYIRYIREGDKVC